MRRFTALLLSVLLVFAAGCSSPPPLTEQEYFDGIYSGFKNYNEASQGVLGGLKSYSFNIELLDVAEEALDDLEALSPPEEYKELHKALCSGINDERTFVKLVREGFTKISDGSADKAFLEQTNKELQKVVENSGFGNAMVEIVKKYKENNP